MARYEDYVNRKDDELDKEIQDAREQHRERGFEMPERFQNKSPEEIARSYLELEKKWHERDETIGTLRRQVDELVALESVRRAQPEPQEEEPLEVSVDDFYDNPTEVISKVAERTSSKKIEDLERQVAESRAEAAMTKFQQKFPTALEDANTPEFREWLQKSAYRQRLAQQADKYDFDAANDLFEMYYDTQGVGADRATQERDERERRREQQLRDASAERGGAQHFDTTPKYSRSEIVQKKIAAKRGDFEAEAWLKANQDAIAIAYAEGNVTD